MRGALLALVLVPALALADEPPVAPIEAGAPAAFDGLLVPPGRMQLLLECDLRRVEAEGNVAARDKALKTLEEQLATEKQRQISGSGSFGFWSGLVLGVVATGALVWAVK